VSAVPALTAPRVARALRSSSAVLDSGLTILAVRKPGVPIVEVRLRMPFLAPPDTTAPGSRPRSRRSEGTCPSGWTRIGW
jgi:hypothetical protein